MMTVSSDVGKQKRILPGRVIRPDPRFPKRGRPRFPAAPNMRCARFTHVADLRRKPRSRLLASECPGRREGGTAQENMPTAVHPREAAPGSALRRRSDKCRPPRLSRDPILPPRHDAAMGSRIAAARLPRRRRAVTALIPRLAGMTAIARTSLHPPSFRGVHLPNL